MRLFEPSPGSASPLSACCGNGIVLSGGLLSGEKWSFPVSFSLLGLFFLSIQCIVYMAIRKPIAQLPLFLEGKMR
jgi:hypothetical protein